MEHGSIINGIAFIRNYLPHQCGVATFTTDLCEAVASVYIEERVRKDGSLSEERKSELLSLLTTMKPEMTKLYKSQGEYVEYDPVQQ
jgi:hypothetical protein